MSSIVIAAHNEAPVIGRCLDAALAGAGAADFECVVVANGCTDRTAEAARRPGVQVIELPEPGKAAALNAGDRAVATFPRLYLDADIALSTKEIRALFHAVTSQPADGLLAAVPRRHLAVDGRPIAVRAYYAIQRNLPVFERSLFGRGAIALSETGRRRFRAFPDELADDLFLDSLFSQEERGVVTAATSEVQTPRSTGDLLRRLVRVRRANRQLARSQALATDHGVRRSERWSWLRDVVLPRPSLLPAGAVYAALTVTAEALARWAPDSRDWGHDVSTRTPAGPETRRP